MLHTCTYSNNWFIWTNTQKCSTFYEYGNIGAVFQLHLYNKATKLSTAEWSLLVWSYVSCWLLDLWFLSTPLDCLFYMYRVWACECTSCGHMMVIFVRNGFGLEINTLCELHLWNYSYWVLISSILLSYIVRTEWLFCGSRKSLTFTICFPVYVF